MTISVKEAHRIIEGSQLVASLRQEVAELKAKLEKLKEFESSVKEIASESRGVVGWHLNGAVALWDEFDFIEKLFATKEAALVSLNKMENENDK